MSFSNTFVEIKDKGQSTVESLAEEYTTADDPIQHESMHHNEEYNSDGDEFDEVFSSLVQSTMKDENTTETVNVATVGSAGQLGNEKFFESAAMKPNQLVEMLQSMASTNLAPNNLRSSQSLISVDPKAKSAVVHLPEIAENSFQVPPSLEPTDTMDIPVLWNTMDDGSDDEPLVSVPRETELSVIDENCIEMPTYIIYTYKSDPQASFDTAMIAEYANQVRPIYRQFYEAQADIEDMCEDNRKFLEKQSNRSEKWTDDVQITNDLKRSSRWSPVAPQPNFPNKSMDAVSSERLNSTVPVIQQEVAVEVPPFVAPNIEPPRDPRLRLSAPTYRKFNQMRTPLPPPQQMSPVAKNSIQQPQIPSLLSLPATLQRLPPLTLLSTLPPLHPTQLKALFPAPPVSLVPPMPHQQRPSNSPIVNGPTAQWKPNTIATAQWKPATNATATAPAQKDNLKEVANSFKSYRDYRRYKESISGSPTDTVTTVTKPSLINPKIQKANEQLFGTRDLSDRKGKSTDRTAEQKIVPMSSSPIHSNDKPTETIAKKSESKINAVKPLINQTDDSSSADVIDKVNISITTLDSVPMVNEAQEISENPIEDNIAPAMSSKKKKSKTSKKKASKVSSTRKSDANVKMTASVKLRGVEIKVNQLSVVLENKAAVEKAPSASKPTRKRVQNSSYCEMASTTDATADEDDLPLSKRFRLSDNAKSGNIVRGSSSSSMTTPKHDQTILPEMAPQPIPTIKLSTLKINAAMNKIQPTKRFAPLTQPIMKRAYIKLQKVRLENIEPVVRENIQQHQEAVAPQPDQEHQENIVQQLEPEQPDNVIQPMEQEPEPIEEPVQLQIENEPNIHDDGTCPPLDSQDATDDYHKQLVNSILQGMNSYPNEFADPDVVIQEEEKIIIHILSSDDEE